MKNRGKYSVINLYCGLDMMKMYLSVNNEFEGFMYFNESTALIAPTSPTDRADALKAMIDRKSVV